MEIIGLIAVCLPYPVLLTLIWILGRERAKLQQDLRETTREYKLYQASVNKDYKTAGILRNSFAGVKNEPVASEPEEEKIPPPGTVLTQVG